MNPNSTYRPDIDGLRAVAVLAVVLHHLSAPLVPGGYAGVDVFFVISGYLITSIISREMEEGSFTFARFYERRARRIFPALFAMLAITLVAGYLLLLPSDYSATLRAALGTLLFSSNIIFWREMADGYFAATDTGLNPLLHTWSLAVEEQFYVFFPFLLLLCYRYFRRHTVLILIGCVVLSLAAAVLLVQSKGVAVFFLSPFRAWELLAGSLLAFNAVPAIKSRLVREVVAGAGLLAIVAVCFLYDSKTNFPGLAALAPVLGAAAIMHAGASGPSLVGRMLQWRPVVYVGLISYSLYLWHWPLIVLTRYATGMGSIAPYLPVLLAASLALGSLSYHFIEQPFRRGMRLTRTVVFSSSAMFAAVVTVISTIGLVEGGFENRFAPAVLQLDAARFSKIPFVNCVEKPVDTGCMLGVADGKPTVLLWGDSHLLAWAPALNESLARQSARAVFLPNSGCAPMLEVDNLDQPACAAKNLAIKNYLLVNLDIKTVVMSANWSLYFREDGPLMAQAGNPPAVGTGAASNALASTIRWLHDEGRRVVMIGPVPVYDKNVPLALALEKTGMRHLLYSSMDEQRRKNSNFLEVINGAKREGGAFRYLDPIQWFCALECVVTKNGMSLYRDSNHLSVAGAMAWEPHLSRVHYEPSQRSDRGIKFAMPMASRNDE